MTPELVRGYNIAIPAVPCGAYRNPFGDCRVPAVHIREAASPLRSVDLPACTALASIATVLARNMEASRRGYEAGR